MPDVDPTPSGDVRIEAKRAAPAPTAADSGRSPSAFCRDPILVLGSGRERIGLLHLAAVRSDDVSLLTDVSDDRVCIAADRLGVVRRGLDHASVELGRAAAVLVAECHPGRQEEFAAAAHTRSVPVFVAGRPDLSDFTLLDFLERRACSRAGAAPP